MNYKCTQDLQTTKNEKIINSCAKNIEQIKLAKILDKGTSGTVFFSKLKLPNSKKNISVAVKRIETYPRNINEMDLEVEYSYYMYENGIGPKIYDAFYIEKDSKITQYIIMELGDGSVATLLDKKISYIIKRNSVMEMISKVINQINKTDMYCLDIKPGNFIYKLTKKKLDVKMIDFGKDFCSLNEIPSIYKEITNNVKLQKRLYLTIVLVQLFVIIYEEHHQKNICKILEPFFKNYIFGFWLDDLEILKKIIIIILEKDPNYTGFILKHYVADNKKYDSSTEVANKVIFLINDVYLKCK